MRTGQRKAMSVCLCCPAEVAGLALTDWDNFLITTTGNFTVSPLLSSQLCLPTARGAGVATAHFSLITITCPPTTLPVNTTLLSPLWVPVWWCCLLAGVRALCYITAGQRTGWLVRVILTCRRLLEDWSAATGRDWPSWSEVSCCHPTCFGGSAQHAGNRQGGRGNINRFLSHKHHHQ